MMPVGAGVSPGGGPAVSQGVQGLGGCPVPHCMGQSYPSRNNPISGIPGSLLGGDQGGWTCHPLPGTPLRPWQGVWVADSSARPPALPPGADNLRPRLPAWHSSHLQPLAGQCPHFPPPGCPPPLHKAPAFGRLRPNKRRLLAPDARA